MPELPEVETVTNQIRPKLIGQKFISVKFSDKNLRYNTPKSRFDKVLDSKITAVIRRAKYIQIFFTNQNVLILHLGMSGKLLINNASFLPNKHDHITVKCVNDSEFIFNDPRRFGMFDVVSKNDLNNSKYFKDLGVEALDENFNADYLFSISKISRTNIKSLIMNQNNVVGIGNIYALESLFKSNIHPQKLANKLTKKNCKILVKNIKKILLIAIEKGGSSIRDYKQVDGSSAYFQHEFYVYGKEDENCKICSNKIERIIQNNRSSFFCPNCQKIK
ncbi:MAG: bifunctional DNA-formamidopyrimidine glycosylase/DNA-(apurinic or apyrimidinic site) lyase [Rickettsiales bacterium]|jgi:formamidopyrimidine-DNA glycosylase|nr:bifunctional DNA-formamidopyrimidine glycosylase/DNA-(apurinic or apyrimidinic site) lyase [Rickettsiales bacterium]